MKVACWNVNSINTRSGHLLEHIDKHDPDLILLQEIKCEEKDFPRDQFSHLPYNIEIVGQKTYNGVAIFSKYKIDEVKTTFSNNPCADQARFLEVCFDSDVGYSRVISVYVPNGGEIGSDKFKMKLDFLKSFRLYLNKISSKDENIIIGGDFNVAPFDIDVHAPKHLQHTTCFTDQERMLMRSILNDKWLDLFRLQHPNKNEYSWWDYRSRAFEHNQGMRIDMILGNSRAADRLQDFVMDASERGKEKPSDHIPITASFA